MFPITNMVLDSHVMAIFFVYKKPIATLSKITNVNRKGKCLKN